ncbi:MAG TPA: hypothetical protein DHW02_00360 [Ktedonobacter sp.]|nr:hypothetical protein [Ktedonobacter sp.]
MLRFATFLSPVLYDTYASIAQFVGERLGVPTALHVGQSLDEFASGQADVGFLCGLLYANMSQPRSVELLVAPIVQGTRYRGEPIYYSDVIVHRDSSYGSFKTLRGCRWAYNEEASHSGYNVVYYSLLEQGANLDYFGSMLKTGSHLASLQAVLAGEADATAIDSHVLDVWLKQQPELAQHVRVIDMLGPSTIPPIVAAPQLGSQTMHDIQSILCDMHQYLQAAERLHNGLIERFVPVTDTHYDNMRHMFKQVQEGKSALHNRNERLLQF